MNLYTLSRRWRTGPLAVVEAESLGQAVETAASRRVSLAYADLQRLDASGRFLPEIDLRGADLERANLTGTLLARADLRTAILTNADLSFSSLEQADFRRSHLRSADLTRADLTRADFLGADLRDVCVTDARIDGVRIDWRWSTFVIELLRRAADSVPDAFRLITEIALGSDDRPYSWLRPILRNPHLIGWASSVLSRAMRPGDGGPLVLRLLAETPRIPNTSDASSELPDSPDCFYWVRSMHRRSPARHPIE